MWGRIQYSNVGKNTVQQCEEEYSTECGVECSTAMGRIQYSNVGKNTGQRCAAVRAQVMFVFLQVACVCHVSSLNDTSKQSPKDPIA